MICVEDYEFSYDIFLAEQGLFEDMTDLLVDITNESFGLISINEGVKDTLLKYLTKIKNAVQKVWEKFKNMLTDAVDSKYLNMIKDRVKEFDPNCEISNYPEIDYTKFGNIKAIDFDYNTMKEYLDNTDHFIDHYYGTYMPRSNNENIDQRIQKYCMTLNTIVCHNLELMNVYKYVTDGFKGDIKILEADIKNFNDSQNNIISTAEQGLDNVQVRTNSTNGETTITNASYEYDNGSIIHEDPIDVQGAPAGSAMKGGGKQGTNQTTNQQTTTRVEVNTNNGTQKDATDTNLGFKQQEKAETETDKAKNDQILKDVQVYMSATCGILSAKLKVCRNKYKKYMKILKHFLPITDAVANRNKPVQKVTNVNRTNYEVKV